LITISSAFDAGNIIVKENQNPSDIHLEIRKDEKSDFYQWFYFRVTGAKNVACTLHIDNAGGAAFPGGWKDYRAIASYDRKSWFRVDTAFVQNQTLTITHTPEQDHIYFAYFAPYSMERHHDLIASMASQPGVRLSVAGKTLDGQLMDVLTISDPNGADQDQQKLQYWVTARQHPGEIMAEWWMEGFLDRLTNIDDRVARDLLSKAVFHIVPNMNPDGSRRGHLRTNAAGINLNREWDKASLEKSPEVYYILQEMNKTGVDFALDVHGDEALPYNFIAGAEGVPSFTDHGGFLLEQFKTAYKKASSDFQTVYGYPVDPPGRANLAIATNYIAETFGCLAMTLEMPFKDNADDPDPQFGWSPERAKSLGAASLEPMHHVMAHLRA